MYTTTPDPSSMSCPRREGGPSHLRLYLGGGAGGGAHREGLHSAQDDLLPVLQRGEEAMVRREGGEIRWGQEFLGVASH